MKSREREDIGVREGCPEEFPPGFKGLVTAYGLTSRGTEKIESYPSIDEAIKDMLEMWPEDTEHDVAIMDSHGDTAVYMARGTDPAICLVIRLRPLGRWETYHVKYQDTNGRVESVVTRLR